MEKPRSSIWIKPSQFRGGFSASDWSFDPDANPTILDAQGQGRVLFITGEIAPVIDGLRLTDGTALSGGGVSIYTATVTLQHTRIYSNTAGQWGGGVYLENSPSIISDNLIYSNTTLGNGNGGGLALANSSAVLITNTISDNRAHRGGGIYLANYKSGSGALLDDNLIQDNIAFDYSYGGNTYDGAGGGIYIISGYTDTLQSNVISQNTARRGGGLNLSYTPAVLFENTIRENYAPYHGGGLYIQGSQPAIYQNQILTNTADSWGGGMSLLTDFAIVKGNTFQGNTAGECGGGLYTQSASEFVGNIFLANTAVEQGGGIFIVEDIDALYQNTVLVGNHAAEGGGIYLWGAVSHFYHTTISANSSTDGRAVVIDKYPGLVDPLATQHVLAKVAFTNTILANQTTGIFATAANTLTVNGVLWYNTPPPIQAAGASLTRLNEFTGDPKFEPDGYHLKAGSSAIDSGGLPALDHDVDGQLRPDVGQL